MKRSNIPAEDIIAYYHACIRSVGDLVLVTERKRNKYSTRFCKDPVTISEIRETQLILTDIHGKQQTGNSSHVRNFGRNLPTHFQWLKITIVPWISSGWPEQPPRASHGPERSWTSLHWADAQIYKWEIPAGILARLHRLGHHLH